jgi:hypothetical protein
MRDRSGSGYESLQLFDVRQRSVLEGHRPEGLLPAAAGRGRLSDYRFGSSTIRHAFCRHCGIKPFGQGNMEALGGIFYAVNVACLDGAAPEEMASGPIVYQDGKNNAWDKAPSETRHL